MAKQIVHLTIFELQKAELDITALIRLFVLLIQIGQSNYQKEARICRQPYGGFNATDWIQGGKEQQLVDIIFHVVYQWLCYSFE